MRRHILSLFAQSDSKNYSNVHEPTRITETIEDSDIDEFNLNSTTELTHSIEDTDPDEYYDNPTIRTFSAENTDEDEFVFC